MSQFIQALVGAGIALGVTAVILAIVWWWTKYPPIPNDADNEIR